VDTHQDSCYDTLHVIPPPAPGQPFFGQDAQFNGNQPSYRKNGDGTVTDLNTGLMWVQERGVMTSADSAISGAADCRIGGYSDWRLPNAKELQSVVDYTRAPAAINSSQRGPAIDTSVFAITAITNERGDTDYPWFWTGTTHLDGPLGSQYTPAVYVTFGRASGWMMLPGNSYYSFLDVHGAGAQRSDPKRGSPKDFYLGLDSLGDSVFGRGPQGDCIHIENYVRLVRNAGAGIEQGHSALPGRDRPTFTACPNPFRTQTAISLQLTANSPARIAVCDASGRIIRSFAIRKSPFANRYSVTWDGADGSGSRVSPGVCFFRLDCAGTAAEAKLLKLD